MKRPLLIVVFVFIVSAVMLSACGGGAPTSESSIPKEYAGKTNPYAGDADAIAAGKVLFEAQCSSCHGPGGKGDGPAGQALNPPAADLTKVTEGDDYEFYRISEGGGFAPYNSAMPPHKSTLTEDQIWKIISFVDSLK